MKSIKYINKITLLLFAVTMFASCTKNNFEPSKITYLPQITLNGSDVVAVDQDSAFVDPGASATENGNAITVTTTGSVDVSTPSVYQLTYTAVNKDGFSVSAKRIVVVCPPTAIVADDIVGDYSLNSPVRPSPIPKMTVSNVGTKIYAISNIYGSNGSNSVIVIPAYAYTSDGITYNLLDASALGGSSASGGTATWNSSTHKLTCVFQITSAGANNFGRTWLHN